ncbi:MAG TPA: trypsin-like peptidase domain-containing protein [Pyrinomonadaceae bacterium]|nr:trypsin-like peptidase domain-containing protein [Pyrinomonadaceae bacterium]
MFIDKITRQQWNLTAAFLLAVISGVAVDAQTPNSAALLSDSFAEVAKKVEAAVVSIDTKGKTHEAAKNAAPAPSTPDDIMEFFRRQSRRPTYAVGSGFIVEKTGYILTNAHVVAEAARITVKLDNGDEFPAKVIGKDDETDIAVLKIEAGRELPVAQLGNSDAARVGEWVLAIGSPFGLARTVTAGIVSQTNRDTPTTSVFQKFIQTDAAINRGNSGGPLVNMKGEVIGINSQIATSTGDYNGVGFALPSNEANYVFKQIVANGKVRRGFLGVSLESVRPEFAKVYGLKDLKGAIVTDVRPGETAAALAGLKSGDVITEFNGQPVANALDLIAKVSATQPDEAVAVGYYREVGTNFEKRFTQIKLKERPIPNRATIDDDTERTKLPVDAKKEDTKPFGITLGELTPTLAATYKLEGQKGVLVKEINPDSFIADVKSSNGNATALGTGDLIQRINRATIADATAFTAAANKLKKGDAVVLHVLTYNPQSDKPTMKVVQFTVQ